MSAHLHRARSRAARGSFVAAWDYASWGQSSTVTLAKTPTGVLSIDEALALKREGKKAPVPAPHTHPELDQLRSTAIAANDLLSSCLYTAGLCAQYAGPLAPIALLLVSIMLYFYRFIYAEVVTALPINGGVYNALLNTTSKRVASVAACLSLLSYIATAVVSAFSAVQYVQPIWPLLIEHGPATAATVILLAVFAALTLYGIGESSVVAVAMFVLHVSMMTALIIMSIVYASRDGWSIFSANVYAGFPTLHPNTEGHAGYALFLGFSSALLGISGFETAANYVEEMRDAKVYVNTVRNMWLASAFFNPCISFCAMAVMPMADIYEHSSNLLAPMSRVVGGSGMEVFVCIDGVVVLSGAVLTAYVGVVGLVNRLSMDRIFPEVFMWTNSCRGTKHWAILGFFALCASLFLILAAGSSNGEAQMNNLSGVYALAFLSVMAAFAIACLVLKMTRPELPRITVTRPWIVVVALCMVFIGLVATIIKDPEIVSIFVLYFFVIFALVLMMFERGRALLLALYVVRSCTRSTSGKVEEKLRQAHERNEAGHEGYSLVAVGVPVDWTPAPRLPGLEAFDALSSDGSLDDVDRAIAMDATLNEPARARSRSARLGFFTPEAFAITDEASLEELLSFDENEGLPPQSSGARLLRWLKGRVRAVNDNTIVFFAKNADFVTLNRAIGYIRDNEQCSRICVVHFVDDREAVRGIAARAGVAAGLQPVAASDTTKPPLVVVGDGEAPAAPSTSTATLEPIVALELLARELPPVPSEAWLLTDNVALLDTVYPQFQLDCIIVRGSCFSPPAVAWLTRHLRITPNFCFMAMPDAKFDHKLSSLGGVRLITQSDSRDQRARNVARTRAVLSRIAEDILEHEIILSPDADVPRPTPQSPRVAAAVAAAAAAAMPSARTGGGGPEGRPGRHPLPAAAMTIAESMAGDDGCAVAQALSFAQAVEAPAVDAFVPDASQVPPPPPPQATPEPSEGGASAAGPPNAVVLVD